MTFSQGSSIENTNVDSNHILCLQKNILILEDGRRVKAWLGFAGGRFAGIWAAVGDMGVTDTGGIAQQAQIYTTKSIYKGVLNPRLIDLASPYVKSPIVGKDARTKK